MLAVELTSDPKNTIPYNFEWRRMSIMGKCYWKLYTFHEH